VGRREGAAHGRQSGGGARAEDRGGGREVDEGGLKSKIPKTQGLHCNVQVTLNQSSNEDGPKSKNVGFFKIYNFALRFICRRATDLKLL
jgi:hypothetical protein